MKIMNKTLLNNLFNEKRYDILYIYLEGLAKKRNINAYFDLFSMAFKKNDNFIIDKMLSFDHMKIGKCSNLNIFKEAVAYGSLDVCKRLLNINAITLKYHNNILKYALCYDKFTHDVRKMNVKIEKIQWLLTFAAIRKELKDPNVYNGILLRDCDQLFIPIILPHLKDKTWLKKVMPKILKYCGLYDRVEVVKTLIRDNYTTIDKVELNQLVYSSIIQEDNDLLQYCFSNYADTKEIVQSIIEKFKLNDIHWNKKKYDVLKSYDIDFFKNSRFYCLMVELWLIHYQDQSNHHYRLLDLLDSIKDDLLEYPEIVSDIIENKRIRLEEHNQDFIKLLSYYKLQDKIPLKETIAKRKKI